MKTDIKQRKTQNFAQTNLEPDYKDSLVLRRFITDRGKIIAKAYNGLTAKRQRALSEAIKRARYMGLLPYTDKHSI